MAEGPKIMRSDDGLYVRYEFDAHYISDEDVQRIRGYIDQLQAENAKLQDENARLRSCLSDDAENARMIMGENAKLRELVARMARALRIGGDWCDRDCLAEFGCTDSCSIADAMRELGIEVE